MLWGGVGWGVWGSCGVVVVGVCTGGVMGMGRAVGVEKGEGLAREGGGCHGWGVHGDNQLQ